MDLKSYLETQPFLKALSTAEDQEQVLTLASRAPMRVGGIELLYDRHPDFQALLRCQGSPYVTLMGSDGQQNLLAVVSFSAQKKWVQGKLVDCCYVGDFRTNQTRQATAFWRQQYARILQSLREDLSFNKPQLFLTAVLKKNTEALRNLTQNKKDFGFRYDFLTEMQMINVFGQWPWAPKATLKTMPAQKEDTEALKIFLAQREKNKLFGAAFEGSTQDEWSRREKQWPGFSIEDFLLQKDAQGRIQACTLPWDPGFAKRMTVVKAPSWLMIFFKFLKLLGFPMPAERESLRTLYLTHLNLFPGMEKESLLSFVQYSRSRHKDYHMISFADQKGWADSIKGLITQVTPVLIFTVALPSDPALSVGDAEVAFEMGLV